MNNEGVLGRTFLRFEYAVVGLPDLSAKDYETADNPLAASLAALMRSTDRDRVERKFRMLQRMASSRLDEARKLLLATIIDRYLPLTPSEQTAFANRLVRDQGEGASATMSIYTLLREEGRQLGLQEGIEQGVQQGVQQGIEQGIEQGIRRGRRETLIRQLRAKFGELPESVTTKVETIESAAELDALLDRILTATTLTEMGL